MTYVIDASVAAEYLLRTPLGVRAAQLIEPSRLLAPALLDVEVLSVLRRGVRRGVLSEARAQTAVEDLVTWPIERIPHPPLLKAAWIHHHNLSAYDSVYVAAAKLYDVPLLSADRPLARAPNLGITVQNIRLA